MTDGKAESKFQFFEPVTLNWNLTSTASCALSINILFVSISREYTQRLEAIAFYQFGCRSNASTKEYCIINRRRKSSAGRPYLIGSKTSSLPSPPTAHWIMHKKRWMKCADLLIMLWFEYWRRAQHPKLITVRFMFGRITNCRHHSAQRWDVALVVVMNRFHSRWILNTLLGLICESDRTSESYHMYTWRIFNGEPKCEHSLTYISMWFFSRRFVESNHVKTVRKIQIQIASDRSRMARQQPPQIYAHAIYCTLNTILSQLCEERRPKI